jgi:thioredoxin-disulfide reductase
MDKYDVIIIGAGAGGLTAAIYTCRKNLKTAVISVDIGGQTNLTNHIENYPGVDPMPGPQLMQKFKDNAASFGAEFIMGKVTRIDKNPDGTFTVSLGEDASYLCRSVILAFGTVPRELGIPGEAKFLGRGLSTCTTCDAPLFKDKIVAVIGGGNAAVEGALELAKVGAKHVYLVHRRKEFRADEITMEKVKAEKAVEFVVPYNPTEILGDKFVNGLKIKNTESNEEKTLQVNGVFKEIGFVVDVAPAKHLVKVNERNEIIIDAGNSTSVSGIFAVGDVTTVPYKQTVISAGEGAKAALECYKWLSGQKAIPIDWDVKGKK